MNSALPSYDYAPSVESASVLGVFLAIYGVVIFIALALALVITIFQGIGIMKMHKTLGLKGGWMAFVPILNYCAIGKVAQQYVKENGKKSAKFSIILPILNVLPLIMVVIYIVIMFCIGFAMGVSGTTDAATISNVTGISSIIWYICYFPVAIAVSVINYIALWRIYAIFSNQNATLFLVLSIFIQIVQPFIIFAIRNNEPICVEMQKEISVAEPEENILEEN